MPLLPIDLQTLFSQSNQVGREQAVQKENAALYQALQGAQMVQKNVQKDASVNRAETAEEGAESIRDRREKERRRRRQAAGGRPNQEPEAKKPPPAEPVSDPDLGRKIDVSG